jgi:hypothetical protein
MLVEKLIDFEDSISTIDIFSNISSEFSFSFRFFLKKISFENFNIFENNIISVELARVGETILGE